MEADFEGRTFSAALAQVEVVLSALRALPGNPWVGYFERLESCLKRGDVECSVRARDSLPIAGMGGFGEFLEGAPQVQSAHKKLLELVGALKLHSRYGITRE